MDLQLKVKATKILTTGNINYLLLDEEEIEIDDNFNLLGSLINTTSNPRNQTMNHS